MSYKKKLNNKLSYLYINVCITTHEWDMLNHGADMAQSTLIPNIPFTWPN